MIIVRITSYYSFINCLYCLHTSCSLLLYMFVKWDVINEFCSFIIYINLSSYNLAKDTNQYTNIPIFTYE